MYTNQDYDRFNKAIQTIKLSRERKKYSKIFSNQRIDEEQLNSREDLAYILSEQINDYKYKDDCQEDHQENYNDYYDNCDIYDETYLDNEINCGDISDYTQNRKFELESNYKDSMINFNSKIMYDNDDYDNLLIKNKCERQSEFKRIANEKYLMKTEEKSFKKKYLIVKEHYHDYIFNLLKRDCNLYYRKKDQWVYDLIDGISIKHNDRIFYQDPYFILINDKHWINFDSQEEIHLLILPTDKRLRTLRSLRGTDITLLEHMKNKTEEILKKIYDLEPENLLMYFHYKPSIYHLHIHVVNTFNKKNKTNVINSHNLDQVIYNLELNSDYYREIDLPVKQYLS